MTSLRIAPDGAAIVTGDGESLRIWELYPKGYYWQHVQTLTDEGCFAEIICISPDGRRLITSDEIEHSLSVWDLAKGERTAVLQGHSRPALALRPTPDARMVVSFSGDRTIRVWDLDGGECVAAFAVRSQPSVASRVAADGRVACGTMSGEMVFLTLRNLETQVPFVTAVRLWLFGGRAGERGRWDGRIRAECPWCGIRSPASDDALDAIRWIVRNVPAARERAPCLVLPEEAWEEPGLLSDCHVCHGPLRFNPFVVDRRDWF